MGLKLMESSLTVYDQGNKQTIGFASIKNMRFNLFTNITNAMWAADRVLKEESYPLAEIRLIVNRKAFKLQPGNLFKFKYTAWGITNMVCRVINIQEQELGSEELVILAREDVDYISEKIATTEITLPNSQWTQPDGTLSILADVYMVEAPYLLSGSETKAIPLAAKVSGREIGYQIYESVDSGATYYKIQGSNITPDGLHAFTPFGLLQNTYSKDVTSIDDEVGLTIKFQAADLSIIANLERSEIFGTRNLALLGDEFITFQTKTLVSGTTYKLLGVNRSIVNQEKFNHPVGTRFFFIGDDVRSLISFLDNPTGSTRYYKFVAFSATQSGDPDLVENPITHTFTGRGLTPFIPSNLKSDGEHYDPSYTAGDDIDLTWSPAYRGYGAGVGVASAVVDAAPTWEGYFRVKVYAHTTKYGTQTLVRTTGSINDDTWTYTNAMNVSDNGSASNWLTFSVTNYRVVDTIEYESEAINVRVRKV